MAAVKRKQSKVKKKPFNKSVIVAVVATLAVLISLTIGVLIWKNFSTAQPSDTQNNTTQPQDDASPQTPKEELSERLEVVYGDRVLTVKYPADWSKIVGESIESGIASPSGDTIILFSLTPPEGIGGVCGEEEVITDPLISSRWALVPGIEKAIFVARVTKFVQSDYTPIPYYVYQYGLAKNSADIKSAKKGVSSCPLFIFSNFVGLDDTSGAVLQARTVFKSLYNEDMTQVRSTVTEQEIDAAFASEDAKMAQKILQALTLK